MSYNKEVKRKINQYFKDRWGASDYRAGWLKMDCPWCGKLKFGVHIANSKANCFSCGNKGTPLKAIMELENFETLPQLYTFLKAFEGIDFLEPTPEIREWSKVELPESFRLLAMGNSLLAKSARSYMENRGFNILKLSARGVGYCTSGSYAGFIILPFYQRGKLIYFIGRQFIQMGEKFKNPSVEDFGIGKSMLVYNIDSLAVYKKIYAVESITNCLTIGDNSIATLGKKVSGYQLSLLIKSPCKYVILGYDDDAMVEAISLGLQLVNYKKIKILEFPKGKDINNLGRKTVKSIEKQSKWLSYGDLINLKSKYETTSLSSYY
jgi:DNA primase